MQTLSHIWRLARAVQSLASMGGALPADTRRIFPLWARMFLPKKQKKKQPAPLAAAIARLGPSYIKLGQFLAVRPDIIGVDYAKDLSHLHDKVPPFSQKEAEEEIRKNFGGDTYRLFSEFGPVVAAASIAQVHKARDLNGRHVAVKILRPGIEKKFQQDIKSFFWVAKKIEKRHLEAHRLQPIAVLESLQATTLREMDLRLEAAAMSEMSDNSADMDGLYIIRPDWQRTCRYVLTAEWVDGIAINDIQALKQAGHDLPELAARLLSIFLTHALAHGFFHADFHPGNLFVRADGVIAPVDFGIMGRLEKKDRQAMAWILHGLINADYLLAAREHIYAGYVPANTDAAIFAQALRAIGEPILDRSAEEISMAELLWQLFETARNFQMRTQPQLLLLQKTMLAAEGLARRLDPKLNIWNIATPVIEEWRQQEYAPPVIAAQMAHTARRLWRLAPEWLDQAERADIQTAIHQDQPPARAAAATAHRPAISLWALACAFIIGLAAGAAGFWLKLWPLSSF